MSSVSPDENVSLEEYARRVVGHLPRKEQTQVVRACRALDQVGRRDEMGRVAIDQRRLAAALKMHQPGGFVDGWLEELRTRLVEHPPANAPVLAMDRADEARPLRDGQSVSWIELAKSVSPYDELPQEETMAALGLTFESTNADVRRVIKMRTPDFPDVAFDGEATVERITRGMERLGGLPRGRSGGPDDAMSAARGFSWSDFFYCMKDHWLDWLILSISTFLFILIASGGNWPVALTLAVIYVPFWAVVVVVGCVIWAFGG